MEKNWKKIWSTTNLIEAEIIKQMLLENEVHAVLMNKQISPYNFGTVELYVHEQQAEAALRLMADNNDVA